jgi:hypothetical protein
VELASLGPEGDAACHGEVPDGQFDDDMATMVFVHGHRGSFEVADERVMAPRGEQLGLVVENCGERPPAAPCTRRRSIANVG